MKLQSSFKFQNKNYTIKNYKKSHDLKFYYLKKFQKLLFFNKNNNDHNHKWIDNG